MKSLRKYTEMIAHEPSIFEENHKQRKNSNTNDAHVWRDILWY